MRTKQSSYLATTCLAAGVLYYAFDLSRGDRSAVDFVVIGLVSAALGWNLIQLGRRLHRAGGGRSLWHLQRTLLFWTIGLMNTAWIRPEDVGSWNHGVGWLLLGVAAFDTVLLYRAERAALDPPGGSDAGPTEPRGAP